MTFKIKANPTFPAIVKIPTPGGEPQELSLVFKHKTRSEFDSLNKEMEAFGNDLKNDKKKIKMLLSLIESWDADAPLSEASLAELSDQYAAAFNAIYGCYWQSLLIGKQGN